MVLKSRSMDTRVGCPGECIGDGVGLKCNLFNFISKGGHKGFWRMGRLPTAEMILIVYCVIKGFSLEVMNEIVPFISQVCRHGLW